MANITFGGQPAQTIGELPEVGSSAPAFTLTDHELNPKKLSDFEGSKLVLNIFPSVNTGVCSASVRKFNEAAGQMNNTQVLCISKDLPFAQAQFCGAEGIDKVVMLSDYKTGQFGRDYGATMTDSPFEALLSRAVVIIDSDHQVIYTEQVPEIGQEPNYEAALNALG
ncbi:lipid hydroperoxide peroxidase [Aureitalea marina]|uniref:Thiol peroxidase n=2 Tax=Aureitalea marina TaxID=930804 RepID=A0A2S7KTR2_9FLAO|nr:thiol peroxidase [Aureitalea marina]PQB05948.1 lipid hydroperoxide peroxidase [Aureitalea marina]